MEMTGEGYMSYLRALREQIEKDTTVEGSYAEQQKAISLLEEFERDPLLSADVRVLVPQIRRSLTDFYSPLISRDWKKELVLADLRELEKRCSHVGGLGGKTVSEKQNRQDERN